MRGPAPEEKLASPPGACYKPAPTPLIAGTTPMNDTALGEKTETDYSSTLFLPQTDFPMRAGLPEREPNWLKRWEDINLFARQREQAADRPKFTLHDGPPYANGNIHIGHALNKTLKDLVSRGAQMLGYNSAYVPGWDCHGLPIEWKVEEEYRAKGKDKDDVDIIEFRAECRAFAQHWIDVQREEFKRLGVLGDWDNPYLTMSFDAEAQIARELMKVAASGQLYRGSKPVMWSVVERTALAEAEIEYADYESDTIWVKFPIHSAGGEITSKAFHDLNASVVIWTTTPWTIPANRAISYSAKIAYGLYEVTQAPEGNWASVGEKYVLADKLAADVFGKAKVEAFARIGDVNPAHITSCLHPLHGLAGGYDFEVPLLDGEHVTDDTGTGFVHTAPGHGLDDFEIWMNSGRQLAERGIDTSIPFMVDDAGFYTKAAPGFEGARVIDDNGKKGDANQRVIAALAGRGMMVARGRVKHQYPHSWRSKKPVIYRNTPQWFIAMDKDIAKPNDTLRHRALAAIWATRWVPAQGQNRITGMIESRPDWVISRQRAWGVPITVFIQEKPDGSVEILDDPEVNVRIVEAFEAEGADAWYKPGARERFLGKRGNEGWQKVDDILDVWFDSGSTHGFVLEDPKHFPGLAGIKRKAAGGSDAVMYLEGSDQHRGWFQSSLLESCGTRGRAPFDVVLTHGFVLDEHGRKMSKSVGNVTAPQDVIKESGADILRMWVCAADYADDLRIGGEILKTTVDTYRKLRNTLRWLLGNLAHFHAAERVAHDRMPELERLMLHRLAELDPLVRGAYADFDFKRIFAALSAFMTSDLSAFYFDIRKDTLYCEPYSSPARKACLTVLDQLFRCTVTWLAPMLCFTAEEAWLARDPAATSVHLEPFPDVPASWRDDALAEKWRKLRTLRRVVTGALELERAAKRIGSSLEAHPLIYVSDRDLFDTVVDADLAELCITSGAALIEGEGPSEAFRLPDVAGVAVVPQLAQGRKCARSWKITPAVGEDPQFPDVTPRDAQALREWEAMRKAAE